MKGTNYAETYIYKYTSPEPPPYTIIIIIIIIIIVIVIIIIIITDATRSSNQSVAPGDHPRLC